MEVDVYPRFVWNIPKFFNRGAVKLRGEIYKLEDKRKLANITTRWPTNKAVDAWIERGRPSPCYVDDEGWVMANLIGGKQPVYDWHGEAAKDMDDMQKVTWEDGKPVAFYRKASAFDKQVAGQHYKDMKIQPIEFIMANGLDFCQGNAIKYICRHKAKNGVEDLKKAIHYIEMLIEQETKSGNTGS